MAGMTELLPKRALTDDFALRAWAAEALAAREITRSQWAAIVDAFAPHVPVTLSLVYRTPKGVLYVNEFNPDTEKPGWLRYDTFVRGEWRKYPWRTAKNEDVRRRNRRAVR